MTNTTITTMDTHILWVFTRTKRAQEKELEAAIKNLGKRRVDGQ